VAKFPISAFGWKWRILMGSFKLDSWGSRIGKLLSVTVIVAFSIGATFFFRSAFANMLEIEGIGQPLLWRIIGITLTTVFVMLVISNLITGIATVFRAPEIPFLLAKPVLFHRVFLSKFTDNLIFSSWSLAVLGVPLVVAWGLVFHLPWWVIVSVNLFAMAPLVLIAAVVGIVLLLGLVALADRTSPRMAMLVIFVAVFAIVGWAVTQRTRGLIVEGSARASTVDRYLSSLRRETQKPLTPPQWMAAAMRSSQRGDYLRAGFLGGVLTLTSIVWLRWLALVAGKTYYRAWNAFSEMSGRKERQVGARSASRFTAGWLPAPLKALLSKDLLMFARNPNQWAQFLMLIAFLLLYLVNLIWISSRFNFEDPHWKVMVLFLNFAFTGFILATLSVRFVYPLISLEGRSFWVIRSAPISVKLLFWEKFFLAFIVFMGLCELIVFISNHALHVNGTMMMLTTAATFLMGATLTGLAIGMGSLMPDFKDESPMRIASTAGGVVTVIISLVYVALMVAVLAWPAEGYFRYLMGKAEFPMGRVARALAVVVGINLLALLIPLRWGQRALAGRDI